MKFTIKFDYEVVLQAMQDVPENTDIFDKLFKSFVARNCMYSMYHVKELFKEIPTLDIMGITVDHVPILLEVIS